MTGFVRSPGSSPSDADSVTSGQQFQERITLPAKRRDNERDRQWLFEKGDEYEFHRKGVAQKVLREAESDRTAAETMRRIRVVAREESQAAARARGWDGKYPHEIIGPSDVVAKPGSGYSIAHPFKAGDQGDEYIGA
ncbi:MAG: hypothetical protein AB1486_30610 [Planctomycetota bacterium]